MILYTLLLVLIFVFILLYIFLGVFLDIIISDLDFFIFVFFYSDIVFLFLFLVIFVSLTIVLYIKYYMNNEFNFYYYCVMMLLFMLSMVGLLISYSWSVLLLSWEGLGMSSFFLINYYQAWESYNNSLMTLLTMRFGDYLFFVFLSSIFFMNFMGIVSCYYVFMFSFLFIFMAFTKSAQFPFTGWLPKAMSAPTPTSALVHSSTLVTAGMVIIMVYSDMLMYNLCMNFMFFAGFLTMLIGSFLALLESSIKKLVAYSTLSQMGLGMLTFGLGGFNEGFMALVSHGFAKSLLFIQVGYLIHMNMNQQDVRKFSVNNTVSGFMRIQLFCSLLSLCGIMFFSGMVSKELILSLMFFNNWYFIVLIFMLISVFLTFLYSYIIYSVFFNFSFISVFYYGSSVIMLLLTLLEFFFVVGFFYWILSNFNLFNKFYGFSDFLIPVFVFFSVFLMYFSLSYVWVFLLHSGYLGLFSINQLYIWLSKFPPLMSLESFLYSLQVYFSSVVLVMCRKTLYYNNSYFYLFSVFIVFTLLVF